jgi:hypothetical protein
MTVPDQPVPPGADPIGVGPDGDGIGSPESGRSDAGHSDAAAPEPSEVALETVVLETTAEANEAVHRRRLAEIFGTVLPESTSDDVPDRGSSGASDSWYLDNRPPHH